MSKLTTLKEVIASLPLEQQNAIERGTKALIQEYESEYSPEKYIAELENELRYANARIAELERQLSGNDASGNIYTETIAVDPTPTTRLLYVDLTKDDCFDPFDKAVGRKQMSAILQTPVYDRTWA
jgi:hypothetical protein